MAGYPQKVFKAFCKHKSMLEQLKKFGTFSSLLKTQNTKHKNKNTKQLKIEIQAPAGNKGVNLRLNNYFKTQGQNNYVHKETSSGK